MMNCPKCGKPGRMFVNMDDHRAFECWVCKLGWKAWDDGRWELIVGQHPVTLKVTTAGVLVVWEDEEA